MMSENLMVGSHKTAGKKYSSGHSNTFYRPKRFVCSMCDSEFHKWSQLKNHMMDMHGKMLGNKLKDKHLNPRAM